VIDAIRISGGRLSAEILTFGAALRDLRLDAPDWPLTLGLERIEDYPTHSPCLGAVCGRCANRIALGRFTLDGVAHRLEREPGQRHHLHGGPTAGFGQRLWTVADAQADSVLLTLGSPDGDGGYPGALRASCRYSLRAPATMTVEMTAECDAPTIVNLAHHPYWNLDGAGDVRGHRLTIAAGAITETDSELIPTGRLAAVGGTPWDFQGGRLIGAPDAVPYDVNFVLSRARVAAPRFAARLQGARGVAMELWTDAPGLQLYDATGLDVAAPGLTGLRYGPQAGLCLEAQLWPDAPNHPDFPSAVLRPGQVWRRIVEHRFAAAAPQ
jgi:aldose 1-epimerase